MRPVCRIKLWTIQQDGNGGKARRWARNPDVRSRWLGLRKAACISHNRYQSWSLGCCGYKYKRQTFTQGLQWGTKVTQAASLTQYSPPSILNILSQECILSVDLSERFIASLDFIMLIFSEISIKFSAVAALISQICHLIAMWSCTSYFSVPWFPHMVNIGSDSTYWTGLLWD